ncbi:MAG: hypothetical protein HFE76_07560 [Firmicutes bacterium]|nr:hypothetical protein [Bacillota bacterium]
MNLAAEHGLKTIAFCCISTGEFHFPPQRAAEIALETVIRFLKQDTRLDKVIFNVFKNEDLGIYKQLINQYNKRRCL